MWFYDYYYCGPKDCFMMVNPIGGSGLDASSGNFREHFT